MSTQIQRRRGTTSEHATFTGALGEITVDTDKKTVVVHDGATAGGHPLAPAFAAPKMVILTSSGTYTPSEGARLAHVIVIGGGGGGGGAAATSANQTSAGSGGSHGGIVEKFVSNPESATVTIGAAGSGGTAGNSGGDGGASSYTDGTNTLTAGGGKGGESVIANGNAITFSGAPGGTATGGDINVPGQSSHGYTLTGAPSYRSRGGAGGNGPYGSGGGDNGSSGSTAQEGKAATGYGAGGGGAATQSSQSGVAGGAGTAGIVVIREYY